MWAVDPLVVIVLLGWTAVVPPLAFALGAWYAKKRIEADLFTDRFSTLPVSGPQGQEES